MVVGVGIGPLERQHTSPLSLFGHFSLPYLSSSPYSSLSHTSLHGSKPAHTLLKPSLIPHCWASPDVCIWCHSGLFNFIVHQTSEASIQTWQISQSRPLLINWTSSSWLNPSSRRMSVTPSCLCLAIVSSSLIDLNPVLFAESRFTSKTQFLTLHVLL